MLTNGKGGHDEGAARDTRRHLCSLQTWCVLELGHAGACVEVARQPREPADHSRGRRKP